MVRDKSNLWSCRSSKVEQWQINAAVHFNSRANSGKHDFEPVATSFQKLLAAFECAECKELFRVSPEREPQECLRCGCGKTNLNLLKR